MLFFNIYENMSSDRLYGDFLTPILIQTDSVTPHSFMCELHARECSRGENATTEPQNNLYIFLER